MEFWIKRRNIYPFVFSSYDPITIWFGIVQQQQQQQQQQHSLFSRASWGRLEMKPERNKFKVQAH